MDAKEVRTKLLSHTQECCRLFDNHLYLDMARLGECPRKLAWEMLYSLAPGEDIKMRLHAAQRMELNMAHRLAAIFDHDYILPKPIHGPMTKLLGYTSGEIGETLIKIKSVPNDDALPNGRAPNNHYWMTQALMHFGHFTSCIMIYESRASGRIRTYEHSYSPSIGKECEKKAELILAAVKQGRLPKCNCGKCWENGYVEK
jgi:hypothetical protein